MMRIKYLLTVVVFIVAGCSSRNGKESDPGTPGNKEKNIQGNQPGGSTNGFWEKLEMNELRDGNGMVAAILPLPSSWKIMPANSSGGPSITGPHGIQVTDFPAKSFMYNYDQSLQYAYQQGGQQMRAMPGIEQLIQQDFVPWGQSNGLQLVKYEEIPEISKMDKWYSDQLYKAMPSRSDVAAFGIDWKTNDGKPYFMLLRLNVSTSQSMQNWYYMSSGLQADPAHFEAAKKQYIFSLSNMRYNLEPIMVYNRQEAERVGQSWAAHNQRMTQNQANFEAQQQAFVNKSNAINDAIMSGWRERNAASDKNQEQFIDGIYERTNVIDPATGKGYKVAAGANQYWMNSNGEYIGTKLQDYNPNLDDNMNEQKWQQLKIKQ
ncbi:MAG: hypothetical protein IPL50_19840 [Chitinophagaceae bacterium]|nr:hypothetical protein [Chitinophagaceae bacterium]